MKYLFICYPKCTTCQKAQKYLDSNGIAYDFRDISTDNPTEFELREWYKTSGLSLKRFFNTSGMKYRALDLSNKLPDMNEDEQFALLATDGMLVKRPLLVSDHKVVVGFKESEWNGL